MSWFNQDTICMKCADKETKIKEALKAQGKDPRSYEGCGSVPKIETAPEAEEHDSRRHSG